jgi:hypothetical protein
MKHIFPYISHIVHILKNKKIMTWSNKPNVQGLR